MPLFVFIDNIKLPANVLEEWSSIASSVLTSKKPLNSLLHVVEVRTDDGTGSMQIRCERVPRIAMLRVKNDQFAVVVARPLPELETGHEDIIPAKPALDVCAYTPEFGEVFGSDSPSNFTGLLASPSNAI